MTGDYYNEKESVEEYINMAKGVNGQELIDRLIEVLPANSSVLEIGSGPGTDWKILTETYSVTGSDNSSEFLSHLRSENPTGEFLNLDAITLKTDKKFDGIYSNKVLQHLNDDELNLSIKRQYDLLNPNGIICHSFWEGQDSETFKGLFVNYHTEETLKAIFESHFEIASIEAYAEFEKGDSLVLIGRKKEIRTKR